MTDEILFNLKLLIKPKLDDRIGYCCNEQMEIIDNKLICKICKAVKSYVNDIFNKSNATNAVYYKIGNTEFVNHSKREKSSFENIAKLHNEVAQILDKNQKGVNVEIIESMSEYMHIITNKKIKKSRNREDLHTTLLYLSAQQNNNYYTIKDASIVFGSLKHGIGKGKKFIIESIFSGELNYNFDVPIHHLIIKKYLELFTIDGVNLYQPKYAYFCKTVVECMLENNIAYNAIVQSKCIGTIYFLIQELFPNYIRKQKNFSQIVKISENTYTIVYNTLISSDVRRIVNEYIANIKF
jgi:hypothetical protein